MYECVRIQLCIETTEHRQPLCHTSAEIYLCNIDTLHSRGAVHMCATEKRNYMLILGLAGSLLF